MSPTVTWPKAKAAALKGIALDSTEVEALTALAYGTMLNEWDWGAAERAFARAIAAGPNYPTAYQWYADFLAGRGRMEDALVQMGRARDLDPLSRIIGSEYAWLLNCLQRYQEADSAIAAVLRLDPSYSHGLFVLSMIRIEEKRYPEAIENLKRALGIGGFSAHAGAALAAAYARAGDLANAQAQVDELLRRSRREYISPFTFVMAYANMGDLNRAFQYLEQGIRERDVLLPENFFEPLLDPLKKDPRYAGFAARIRGS
jgi:tetratricopeptide (TPR) repeat protein